MSLEAVQRVLRSIDAPHALIGAHAMAARSYPRFAVDIDLLTSDPRVLAPALWTPLVEDGASVDSRTGDAEDPLAGVVHILLSDGTDVDLVVARWTWEAAVIERAEPMQVAGTEIKVPRTSDPTAMGRRPDATRSWSANEAERCRAPSLPPCKNARCTDRGGIRLEPPRTTSATVSCSSPSTPARRECNRIV